MGGRRQSSILAAGRIRSQLASDEETVDRVATRKAEDAAPSRPSLKRRALSDGSNASPNRHQQPASRSPTHVHKRPRIVKKSTPGPKPVPILHERLFSGPGESQQYGCTFSAGRPSSTRLHSTLYHRPSLLLGETGQRGRRSLLKWYDAVSEDRLMPWRKPFNPDHHGAAAESREALSVRAYEVWISEIMLQQTRVAVVKDYWTRWMKKWPTMAHLAAAHEDEVMSAWRGLGYYSRARRILDAARMVVQDPVRRGLLPQTARELESEIPGVGRYTAGAISAIAFGNADCMVDGNVMRVLSRQLGVYGDVKSDKAVIDLLWAAAQALVEAIASEHSKVDKETGKASPSDGPGRWGQALMELGSTLCTPQPNVKPPQEESVLHSPWHKPSRCALSLTSPHTIHLLMRLWSQCVSCPINFTCRAFAEGRTVAAMKGLAQDESRDVPGLVDMEDVCGICSEWDGETSENITGADDVAETGDRGRSPSSRRPAKRSEQHLVLSSIPSRPPGPTEERKGQDHHGQALSRRATEVAISHARRFPVKVSKKAVREEETLVCAVRRTSDGCYLIQKRPDKGLLAGLWELPSQVLPVSKGGSTAASRRRIAQEFVAGLLGPKDGRGKAKIKHLGDLGSVPWVFSHLKLTMHVHSFQVEDGPGGVVAVADRTRWADAEGVEAETMGTGMRHCWRRIVAPP